MIDRSEILEVVTDLSLAPEVVGLAGGHQVPLMTGSAAA